MSEFPWKIQISKIYIAKFLKICLWHPPLPGKKFWICAWSSLWITCWWRGDSTCTSIYADKIHCIHYTHTDLNRHVTSCYSCAYEFLMLISEHRNYIVNFLQILTKWKVHNLTCSCSQMLSLVSGYNVYAVGNIYVFINLLWK